ncbi:MAG: hypothetical protein Kow00120_27090 [Anaerolineae bacterium]
MKDKNIGPLAARVRRCAALGSAALLALIALLSGVAAARAQEPAPTPVDVGMVEALSQGLLKIDEGRTGNLTVDAPAQWWTLPLKAGDAIFITANAEADAALYPQLSLFDPAGNLLSQADNASGSTNVVIPNVTAPQDGNHYVRVTGLFNTVGGYRLRAGRLPAASASQPTATPAAALQPTATAAPVVASPTAPPAEGDALAIGQSVEASLPVGGRHAYTFEAPGGLPVVIDLVGLGTRPTALDPFVELYGPGGAFLYENDDADFGMVDARLEVTLPTTGTYTIIVRGYGDRSGGSYSLSLRVGALWR